MKNDPAGARNLLRPAFDKIFPHVWILAFLIFDVHILIRFGGLWSSYFIPLSMLILWPLPWILSDSDNRTELGFRAPKSWSWLITGPIVSLAVLGLCVGLAWGIFGTSPNNWFFQHALMLRDSLARVPADASLESKFWIVTIPAMIFSPLGEEFLFRGFLLKSFEVEMGFKTANIIQALGFAIAHLAHYGLLPFQPLLILVWLPSMFIAALVFGWIVKRSGSIWIGFLSHVFFNFGMNAVVFIMLPNQIGV